ncbi:glutaredoxin 3 [Elioraea sp. Yellowstone]|jgi:glutaredoxin 3|uniref:glutaredoxin 3 n=1 Tax=Elioraea sp. Yellowstone TaxID=2592070 RepID=UPI001151562D|nr:glutaredoxin 3 [Elioraea sp. Yellowstone]TQF76888.1 glutaredoxin 3 [Elioraea sp. Yellowstone]
MPEIEIYTSVWCPYCAAAKRLLDAKGVAYREIEAPSGSPARAEATERSGGRTTVPQVFVDGTPLGGYDDLARLDRTGELDRLLGLPGTATTG